MFYAYVVKSRSAEYLYKGHCEDLDIRLHQHNSGMTESLRPYIPVYLVYFEEFRDRKDAIAREKYFKSASGRRFLKKKLEEMSA
jgi:putative endonuclease